MCFQVYKVTIRDLKIILLKNKNMSIIIILFWMLIAGLFYGSWKAKNKFLKWTLVILGSVLLVYYIILVLTRGALSFW